MIIGLYYADEDLIEVEKTIYQLTYSKDNVKLNDVFLLEKLFEKGFTFEHYSEKELTRKLLRYLKRYVRETLENLKSKNLVENKILQIRYENFLLLEQVLRVSTKDLIFFGRIGINIALKCIRDPRITNFLSAIFLAILCPTYEEYKRWLNRFEKFEEEEEDYNEYYEEKDNTLDNTLDNTKQQIKKEVKEEQRDNTSDDTKKEIKVQDKEEERDNILNDTKKENNEEDEEFLKLFIEYIAKWYMRTFFGKMKKK